MRCGRVYLWNPDPGSALGGRITASIVPLPRLDTEGEGAGGLQGRYVQVKNGGAVNEPDEAARGIRAAPIGDAQPDPAGDFLFAPGRGGGRMDKVFLAAPEFRWRYIQASHFGEVNTYFHLDHIAAHADGLLHTLGAQPLPRLLAVVNAHHAATENNGIRDGIRRGERWLPFQGGHYRLPSRRYDPPEHEPLSPHGEIHLGPGWQLLGYGALVEAAGGRYRANASHNAGILYHEYGHHITRHTADFRVNALRPAARQSNFKTSMEEGTCDYWAATMLGTPHIWAWHCRHDEQHVHPRSVASSKTMADYDLSPGADSHANGTIWAASLWDLRTRLSATKSDGVRRTDLLLLKSLLLLGQLAVRGQEKAVRKHFRGPESFAIGLASLLQADELLNAGRHRGMILAAFSGHGIRPAPSLEPLQGEKFCVAAKL
jgi:hypothetical protein